MQLSISRSNVNIERLMVPQLIVTFIVSLTVIRYVDLSGFKDLAENIFGPTTFVFGVFLAFYTSTSHARFNSVVESLQKENGMILFLHKLSKVFPAPVHEKFTSLIDNYLIAEIDYFLIDFSKSRTEFENLLDHIITYKPSTPQEESYHDEMIDQMGDLTVNRKQIEANVRSTLASIEWAILIILLAVSCLSLLAMNANTAAASITSALVVTTMVTMLLVLRMLEDFRWKEKTRIWDPLARNFESIGLLPYYPYALIQTKRIKPRPGKVRVAKYPHPYPDMTGKVVEIMEAA